MNHKDWVRKELRELGISLGFRYLPLEEIEDRLTRVRNGMKKQEIEALLVIEKMDFYYLSGTTQDGILFVPTHDKKGTGAGQSGVVDGKRGSIKFLPGTPFFDKGLLGKAPQKLGLGVRHPSCEGLP